MKMEWTEDHDIQLGKEVLGSEPYRFKPLSCVGSITSRNAPINVMPAGEAGHGVGN